MPVTIFLVRARRRIILPCVPRSRIPFLVPRHPMPLPAPPKVDCERLHPGLAVPDVLAAVEFYTNRLGFTLGFTWGEPVTMAGVNLGEVQVFLERGTPNPAGVSV